MTSKKHTLIVLILVLPLAFWILTTRFADEVTISKPINQHTEVATWNHASQAKVFYVHTPEIPIVDVIVQFSAGSAFDGEIAGLSLFVSNMLDKGTTTLSAEQISEGFDNVGARYSMSTSRDAFTVSLRSLSKSDALQPSIQLLADILQNPSFPEEEIQRNKSQILVEIQRALQNTSTLAKMAFYEGLYPNHPYGHPTWGYEATILSITPENLKTFHQTYFTSKNCTITIVGDIEEHAAKNLVDDLLGQLPAGTTRHSVPQISKTPPLTKHISFPSKQTFILLGTPSTKMTDKDYYALSVGNYILGGNPLLSRLFKVVRETRGLAYQIISAIVPFEQPGPFLIQAQTENQKANETLALIQEELNKFLQSGPTDEELNEAKESLIRAFPVDINNNKKIVDQVATMGFYQLPLDYLNTYTDNIQKVTKEDVINAFHKHIHPDNFVTITVGNQSS